MLTAPAVRPFELPRTPFARFLGPFGGVAARVCERALALTQLNAVYERTQRAGDAPFSTRVLHELGVQLQVCDAELNSIPRHGPLVVVANHPFGGLDGLVLLELLQRIRDDARLLANYLLARLPEMNSACLFVDPFGGSSAAIRNRAAMKAAVRWVAQGGALGVFPAGEVAHFTLNRGCVTDPAWSDSIARLALHARATVVPLYFHGRNSRLFQALGMIHPRLRTAMLPRELLRLQGQRVRVEIGTPITPARLERISRNQATDGGSRKQEAAQVTEYLRLRTYILKGRLTPRVSSATSSAAPRASTRVPLPIVPPVPAGTLAAEVAALPADQCLATSGGLRVYFGSAAQLPNTLREIGRLREATFRLVGEGTGREIDLDRFDEHYLHLFVWHADASRVIGAYRMGQTDLLLARFGPAGLYTSTLFRFQPRLLQQIDPALELGRSFVIPEYQRDYASLSLLWKGIGRFVVRQPRYRMLFGAVSISDEFHSMTKQLLMAFLRAHSFDDALAALVRPRTPPRLQRFSDSNESRLAALVSDVADVEELVREIESNRRSVPVLLRQYLKLNAKLLGFNIDPNFGDVVDGLVLIDLAKVERPILNRYLGVDGAASFLSLHTT